MSSTNWKDYRDFVLKIERAGKRSYRVEAQGPAGEDKGTFVLPFDEKDLKIFFLEVGRPRMMGSRGSVPQPAQPAVDFGKKLFNAVFKEKVRDIFVSSRTEAEIKGYGLRLRLRLIDAPELADLPWEYLYDSREFLALSDTTPLIRYFDLPSPPRPITVNLPLRVLVTVSDPQFLPVLDVEAEQAKIQGALGGMIDGQTLELEFTSDATLKTLMRTLRQAKSQGRPFHIWHFIGHGSFDPVRHTGQLAFCDANGLASNVDGFQLGTLFASYPETRLILLNACEGARNGPKDPFAGVATALVEKGIPAVVGMQFEISDEAAIIFSEEFYTALVDGLPVDSALTEARRAIFFMPNWVEWATPVLFMRAPDGVLFNVQTLDNEGSARTKQSSEADKFVAEKAEQKRLEKEKAEIEKLAAEKAEAERLAALMAEQERLEKENAEAERLANEKAEAERSAIPKAEQERLEKEKAEALQRERVRLLAVIKAQALQMAEQERLAKEKAEAERCAAQKTEQARLIVEFASNPERLEIHLPIQLELLRVPAGEFLMGSDPTKDKYAQLFEQPQHRVYLSEFYIDKYPVTNQQYAAFVKETNHNVPKHWTLGQVPANKIHHPVVHVSWNDSTEFCKWLGQATGLPFRLPTEAEWEKAARGIDGRIYPWGNDWDRKKLNSYTGSGIGTTPVGKYSPMGDSPYNLSDMAGNVWEWCLDGFSELIYKRNDDSWIKDPQVKMVKMLERSKERSYRVRRGGSFFSGMFETSVKVSNRCANREKYSQNESYNDIGFRVIISDLTLEE